ncbi:response regulator [Thiobacillus sedimenti]|uniref:Response regulator n=1 Tax=Thiobacillus sedimenti TaxID=3110231 RepID=A0ABZ1CMK4_9PROT|nr:response regulator [Thiobacillus sp. SCUT-2]WRS40633.1 response regulator [Thiobacillus sp. SCUT-2]WRS40647.1 response regulator [Thiobacillus sp. SCUT-2]
MTCSEHPDNLKVLLIEDSPLLRQVLSGMIEDIDGVEICGYAEDEQHALDILETQPIDLAIVDIELKQGSGIGVLKTLGANPERYGTPHTVILSNHSHPAMRKRCESLGIDAFFDKSLQMNQLIGYVQDAVARRSNPSPAP